MAIALLVDFILFVTQFIVSIFIFRRKGSIAGKIWIFISLLLSIIILILIFLGAGLALIGLIEVIEVMYIIGFIMLVVSLFATVIPVTFGTIFHFKRYFKSRGLPNEPIRTEKVEKE
ncbi:MAG: hypothetical protein GF317_05820 [Candidatus Lokiarchaeota archaeon]|nr:hypothetical protein [Candidatus Lokiarchaeota archaeon]